jgi:hypothetical protein
VRNARNGFVGGESTEPKEKGKIKKMQEAERKERACKYGVGD